MYPVHEEAKQIIANCRYLVPGTKYPYQVPGTWYLVAKMSTGIDGTVSPPKNPQIIIMYD